MMMMIKWLLELEKESIHQLMVWNKLVWLEHSVYVFIYRLCMSVCVHDYIHRNTSNTDGDICMLVFFIEYSFTFIQKNEICMLVQHIVT